MKWSDSGTLVEPVGTWTVGPATAPLNIDVIQAADGSATMDRNVISGYSPPGVKWSGNVSKPNPTTFPAVEFDFLWIAVPPMKGSKQQGITPPSYYQLAKSIPGKSVCSWDSEEELSRRTRRPFDRRPNVYRSGSTAPRASSQVATSQQPSAQAAPAVQPARTSVGQWTPR